MAPTITSREFNRRLRHGVLLDQLGSPAAPLHRAGALARLRRLDRDGDGRLTGGELRRAFGEVDRLDDDRSPRTFRDRGPAGALYRALLAARAPASPLGPAIARAAADRARRRGADYAVAAAPRCPLGTLSGNRRPGRTRIAWLAGRWKCNQFVGDVLVQAGVAMPLNRMPDGTFHYRGAGSLHRARRHFRRLTRLDQLEPGDVITIRLAGGGAHTEVITTVDRQRQRIKATGAHEHGAYETTVSPLFRRPWHDVLAAARFDAGGRCWRLAGSAIYLLRARRPLRRR